MYNTYIFFKANAASKLYLCRILVIPHTHTQTCIRILSLHYAVVPVVQMRHQIGSDFQIIIECVGGV